ncbi:HAD hydrolase family protein [Enterococcus faecalis]
MFQSWISFARASGRPLYTLTYLFFELKNNPICIRDNGSLINYNGEIIFKSLIFSLNYKMMISFKKMIS